MQALSAGATCRAHRFCIADQQKIVSLWKKLEEIMGY
jgi:hypothetical protein